jgi:hypothetical protein
MKLFKRLLQVLGVIFLVSLVMAATLVVPGRRIRDYNRVTTLADTHVFVVDNEGAANTNNSVAWPDIKKITNGFASTGYVGTADTVVSNGLVSFINTNAVWTNDGGLVYPRELNGQVTNSIQIYTNGGLTIGRSTRPYWGLAGFNNETLVSLRNITNDTTDFNEIFIGSQGHTNSAYFDMFFNEALARSWLQVQVQDGTISRFDQYVNGSSNFVFRAYNSSSGDIWNFDPQNPSASSAAYYFDTWPVVAQTNRPLFRFDNDSTNKMTLYGNGTLSLSGNLEVSGTITGATATVTALNVTGGTLGAGKILTDTGGTGAATWQAPAVDLGAVTNIVTNYVNNIQLRTNFINLSVQAAKLPGNDNASIGSGFKQWELTFYKTNVSGNVAPLAATWQFVVPPDYATNSLRLYLQQMILATNGPATSNTIFGAAIWKSTPGDSKDLHTNSIYETELYVTNTWSASNSGTNILQSSVINFSGSAPVQIGDLVVLRLTRIATNDTYLGAVAVPGLQLLYARP